jgi:hypothetical protein
MNIWAAHFTLISNNGKVKGNTNQIIMVSENIFYKMTIFAIANNFVTILIIEAI